MRLKWRLTLFFVAIVALPLIAAGIVLQRIVATEVERRSAFAVNPSLQAAQLLFQTTAEAIDERVQAAIDDREMVRFLIAGKRRALADRLAELLRSVEGVDFLAVFNAGGDVIADAHSTGRFARGFEAPTPAQVEDARTGIGPGFIRTRAVPLRVESDIVGSVMGGVWVDDELVREMAIQGIEISIVAGDQVIASTAPIRRAVKVSISTGKEFDFTLTEPSTGRAVEIPGGMALVASVPRAPIEGVAGGISVWMLAILLAVVAVTALLAYLLARLLTQPLEELAEGARSIERGHFGVRISVRSRDEVGQLGTAFNQMSERLQETITELESSRDQMRRSIKAVGEALRSTHDMKQILSSVTSIAADAVAGDAAVLWMLTAGSNELYPARSVGVDAAKLSTVRVGHGIVGTAAERATTLVLPDEGTPRPSPSEPQHPVVIAVPIYSKEKMRGVISVHRADSSETFSKDDLDTVSFLAQQSGVAVENVLLHEEAQRLAITDGLTGVWNRRYFSIQFRQLLATAKRFDRHFSLLMIDLDHFKRVNDQYGHQRGDAVLVELAQRAQRALREVDTLARYGGEEFVCLLAETDVEGAQTTAKKILDAIRSEEFSVAGDVSLRITASIGVSVFPKHGGTLTALVDAADRALYRAKREGRDRVVMAGEETPQPGLRLAQ